MAGASKEKDHGERVRGDPGRPLRGPGQPEPPGLPLLPEGPDGAGQAHGGPAPLRGLLLAHLLRHRRRIRSAAPPSSAPGTGWPIPWQAARAKAESAFEFFTKLGVPFYCFHDRDVAPEGATPRESAANLQAMVEELARHQQRTGVKLLWGTANLFSHRRFMSGAATNPDPEVFALAAAQVKGAMDVTRKLGGAELRAVGRPRGLRDPAQHRHEGGARPDGPLHEHGGRVQAQDRLQGPDPDRAQAARALQAPVRLRHRHRLRLPAALRPGEGGQGQHREQPRHPGRPHLRARDRHGPGAGDLRLGRHEPRRHAAGLGHRPVPEQRGRAWSCRSTYILQGGGFTTGGFNFDAKVRRQSLDAGRPVPRPRRRHGRLAPARCWWPSR